MCDCKLWHLLLNDVSYVKKYEIVYTKKVEDRKKYFSYILFIFYCTMIMFLVTDYILWQSKEKFIHI